ncbi:MAG: hypothetical protein VKL23_01690 [Cyanobacteriota bacterium]|jgi:hypothetical protein|nr:hypothetical protein [Cyanobacteriota bacterium]
MAFDPRSLERLRELGRSLPRPLPKPEPAADHPKPGTARHKLETETDPEALFRELMQASPDGTVPPHLMARLRDLEANRRPLSRPSESQARKPSPTELEARSLYEAFDDLLQIEAADD